MTTETISTRLVVVMMSVIFLIGNMAFNFKAVDIIYIIFIIFCISKYIYNLK